MKQNNIPPRLRWACRRGMLELDILLEKYLNHRFLTADAEEQVLFIELLKETDQDLFDWLLKKSEPRLPEYAPMIEILLA